MNIRISEYELIEINGTNVLMSEKGLSTVTSPPLLEVLRDLMPYMDIAIPRAMLHERLEHRSINTLEAEDFLKSHLNISEMPKRAPFEKVIIAHQYEEELNHSIIKNEIHTTTEFVKFDELEKRRVGECRNFIVILCNRYSYNSLKSLYFKIATSTPQHAIMVAHYMPEHYYVSQPYIPEIGNACHFCHMDRLLSYEEKKKSRNTWSQLLKFSRQKNAGIPERPHTELHRAMAVGLLTARINLYTSHTPVKRHQDSALSSASINLSTGKIDEEIVPHWMLCQCQRRLA